MNWDDKDPTLQVNMAWSSLGVRPFEGMDSEVGRT